MDGYPYVIRFLSKNNNGKINMFIINGKNNFFCADDEFSGVKKIALKVCEDVERVTGTKPSLLELDKNEEGKLQFSGGDGTLANCVNVESSNVKEKSNFSSALFFATLGKSFLAEKICEKSGDTELALALEKIRGKRESYIFAVQSDKIIIIGSDKRGTIYGLFHLSELMGVSPLVDWVGILPLHQDFVEFSEGVSVSKEPSVRFRGFFINDEWPAFGNWTSKRFGGFTAQMYEHVFELLLRLKGNYLWPAMWSSRFSDDGPGLLNAELADELGVIMGASHHEPCCRAGEEYRYLRGKDSIYGDAWNFRSNEKGITKFWEDGLKRNGKFENVITVGMRGEADTAIMQNATLADNINLLRDVIKTQNRLIRENVNKNLEQVPRMLALYKEVEPYFYGNKHTKGLMNDPELDGVTLMLCDDNHGNLRTVPTEEMRNHKGGYGMYYHFDYHGSPYSYEWLNTTALPKVKEQMTAAYEFGIRDLWIVNVGDILTNEYPLSYFLDLAYDYEKYSPADFTTAQYTKKWAERQFAYLSPEEQEEVAEILCKSTKMMHARRTECVQSDTYHPENFCEGSHLLAKAEDLISRTEKLRLSVPENQDFGFFSQVYLPVCGTLNILRMQLYAGKNCFFAERGAVVANLYAKKVKECYDFDKNLVHECDSIADSRFYAMTWSEHFGFRNWCEANNHYPVYMYVEPSRKKRMVAWIEGEEFYTTGQDWTKRNLYLTAFKNPEVKEARVKLASCNEGEFEYQVDLECEWLSYEIIEDEEKLGGKNINNPSSLESTNNTGKRTGLDTIVLKIDRKKLETFSSRGEKTYAILKITANDDHGGKILVNVHIDPIYVDAVSAVSSSSTTSYTTGTFIQTETYVSMEAIHFSKLSSSEDGSHFELLEDYGKSLGALKVFPVTKSFLPNAKSLPYAQYSFFLQKDFVQKAEGLFAFDFYLNPSNPAYKDNKLQFLAEVNGERILKDAVDPKTFAVGDDKEPWSSDVTNNIRIATVYAECHEGLNTLKVLPVTPNFVLEKIVIYGANSKMPSSYLGAPESYRI